MAVPSSAKTYQEIYKGLGSLPFQTDMNAVRARQAELAGFLGTSDYASRMEEANNLAKLQMALAMAQRGYAGMGATPKRGQSGASALLSNVFAPLAGDFSTVAGPLMQQRAAAKAAQEQEERQLKLAALSQVQAEEAARRKLAQSLMPKPVTPKFGLDPYVVVSRDKDGGLSLVKEPGGTAAIQVRQGNVGGRLTITDIKTKLPHVLEPNQEIIKLSVFTKKEGAGKAANVGYMQNKTTKKYEHVTRRGPGEPAYFSKTGLDVLNPEEWTWVGSTIPTAAGTTKPTVANLPHLVQKLEKKDGKLVAVGEPQYAVRKTVGTGTGATTRVFLPGSKTPNEAITIGDKAGNYKIVDTAKSAKSAEAYQREARSGLMYGQMAQIQHQQRAGDFSTYSKKSALYFDPAEFHQGNFPFKFVVDPEDRSKDVTITNKSIQDLIKRKVDHTANTMLKSDFGSQSTRTKEQRLQAAVRSVLSVPAPTLLGARRVEIGETGDGQTFFYEPPAQISPAVNKEFVKNAMASLKDADANAYDILSGVAAADNQEDLNKTWGRLQEASINNPNAFGLTGQPGTKSYDPELQQQRQDIEAGLRNATLLIGASQAERAAVIRAEAGKVAEARAKSQEKPLANEAENEVRLRLEFRRALLAFKNAAAETNVEGFFTGTMAEMMATMGFAEFLVGEGAEHWNRLTQASNRLANGLSRRVGREFGDTRISNYDAEAYKKLLARMSAGKEFNKSLIEDGLSLLGRELDGLMQLGGKVGYTENLLRDVAEAGVDFSKLKTQMNWHGHGYYGKNRFSASRQPVSSLSEDQRNSLRFSGNLKDTIYGGRYTVPITDYTVDRAPQFNDTTEVSRMGPMQFDSWLRGRAKAAQVTVGEMRRRVTRGIRNYNSWRDIQ